jgi:nucleoid DNA-binding protein
MSLNKKKMVREIGRRTRLKNRDVQAAVEALVDVLMEELVAGGRIELEGFLTIQVKSKLNRQAAQTMPNTKRLAITVGNRLRAKIDAAID